MCALQLRQIVGYWILGMVVGSLVSVFAKDAIHGAFDRIRDKKWGVWGIIPASILGIASPLCMYGTISIAVSFSRNGMRDDWLAAFMMSSVLLNPQLIMYSIALGVTALVIRIVSCTVCGIVAGIVVHIFYKDKPFFNFEGFEPRASHDSQPNLFLEIVDGAPYADYYCTDGYFGYLSVIYPGKHIYNCHDKSDTFKAESVNADLRDYIPLLRRRSRCFARSIKTLKAVVEVFVDAYNKFGIAKLMYREHYPKGELPFGLVDFL